MAFDGPQPSSPGAFAGQCIPPPNSMVRRTLCRWGLDPIGPNATPMESPAAVNSNQANRLRGPSASENAPCWWTVEVNAQEIQRATDQVEVIRPLSVDTIKTDGGPCSKLWAMVGWHREGIGSRAVFDISAGMRISVNACSVQLDIITPPDCITDVRGPALDSTAELVGPGIFLDTLIRASIICSCAPIKGPALLTQHIRPAGDEEFIPCPPGVVEAELYSPGSVAPLLGNWMENPPSSFTPVSTGNVGDIPNLSIAAGRSGFVPRPGNATGIRVTAPTTIVWKLEF